MYGYRMCAEAGCERCFKPKSSRNRFCLVHRKTKPRDPSHYRRYGSGHRALRAQWTPRVDAGMVKCTRCGTLIRRGEEWDLGHDDLDRNRYTGPEHASCNRATAAHRVEREGWLDPRSRIW